MLEGLGTWFATVNLTVAIAAFVSIALLEALRPRREQRIGLGVRWTTNLGLQAINSVALELLVPLATVTAIGELWHPAESLIATIGALPVLLYTVLALDLAGYAVHRLQHVTPPLWRLHAVHHADIELDASTGFRHHPIEYLVSIAIGTAIIVALGLPPWAVSLYAMLALLGAVVQHANIALPTSLDRWLRLVFVTPSMHEVHHSADIRDHDSNYGTVFSFWDRLFGTYRQAAAAGADQIRFGVEPFTGPEFSAPHWGLLLPAKVRR